MNILLGVTGSIAAYKAAELANILTKQGHDVHTILTSAALKFVSSLTFQALTKHKVYTDMFEEIVYEDIRHISLAQKADIILIAPASANIIGKLAAGIADDMLSTTVMVADASRTVICPAMNTAMYHNPIVCNNIEKLAEFGYKFIEPRESLLACGDFGKGAMADIEIILEYIQKLNKLKD